MSITIHTQFGMSSKFTFDVKPLFVFVLILDFM